MWHLYLWGKDTVHETATPFLLNGQVTGFVCRNLIFARTRPDSLITSTTFCQQKLRQRAAVVENSSSPKEWSVRAIEGASKPYSWGGQKPTGTQETVGGANWRAGMASSPRRFNIFTGELPVSGLLRRICHASQLPAAGRSHRVGNDTSITCSCLGIIQPKGTAVLTF